MSVRFHNIDPRATIEVLLKHGAHINAYDMYSWTALTECAHSGRLDVAKLLLSHGAHVDGKPGPDDPATASNPSLEGTPHETPLVVCAWWRWREDLICLLIDEGADVEARSKYGKTMAELATGAKSGVVLEKLASVKRLPRIERTEDFEEEIGKDGNNTTGTFPPSKRCGFPEGQRGIESFFNGKLLRTGVDQVKKFSRILTNWRKPELDAILIPERFGRSTPHERRNPSSTSLHVEASTNVLATYYYIHHCLLTNIPQLSKSKPLFT